MSHTLLRRIERHLKKTRMAPTAFGRESMRDPQLVFDMRRGREVRRLTEARILAFIDAHEKMMEAVQCGRR